jgi:hypothetical protein
MALRKKIILVGVHDSGPQSERVAEALGVALAVGQQNG